MAKTYDAFDAEQPKPNRSLKTESTYERVMRQWRSKRIDRFAAAALSMLDYNDFQNTDLCSKEEDIAGTACLIANALEDRLEQDR